MVYVGGKFYIRKFLCEIMQKELDSGKYEKYVEPFGGGGNVIEKIVFPERYYYDSNKILVEFFRAVQAGWKIPEPYSFTQEHYKEVRTSYRKQDGKYPDYYYGFMAYIPSFCGKKFGGYAKRENRDDQKSSYNNIIRQIPNIKDVNFECADYLDLTFENAVIYCDPPYEYSKNNKSFYGTEFVKEEFCEWCIEMKKHNNKIFVSECQMPSNFKCIWEKPYKRGIGGGGTNKETEKLFIL